MKKLFYTTALCLLTSAFTFAQTNLVTNPSFETVTDGVPDDWTLEDPSNGAGTVTFESATSPVYEGSKSLKITCTDYLDVPVYQYISVTPGTTYNMSIWYNIESYEEDYGAYANFGYQFTDADGNNVGTANVDYINEDRTKNTWREFTRTNVTAPTGAIYMKVLFTTQYHIVAYFDSVSVTVASSAGISEETTTSASTELSVRTESGDLVVTTEAGNTIEVYSVVGAKIQSKVAEDGETVISGLPKGQVLIVRSGNAAAKVVL